MNYEQQKEELSKEQREAKVYEISVYLQDLMAQKKSQTQGFNEEIKRCKAEIKELLKPDLQSFEVV